VSKNAPKLSILTANRLGDGTVVFLDFEGAWNENIAEALVAHSPDEVRALEDRGAYDAARNLVVEPYLVEIREAAGRFEPIRYRERVRAAGPSMLEHVPGYAAPSPRAQAVEGVRPLASDVSVSRNRGGEGSDPLPAPLPAGAERERLVEAA
jgi:sulfite reductase (NADPH) hemoprotein beta-component